MIYYVGPEAKCSYLVIIRTHMLTLKILGGVIFPTSFIGSIIHPLFNEITVHYGTLFIVMPHVGFFHKGMIVEDPIIC